MTKYKILTSSKKEIGIYAFESQLQDEGSKVAKYFKVLL